VEKNCSEATTNSGEMLGSVKGWYPAEKADNKGDRLLNPTHWHHMGLPVFIPLWIFSHVHSTPHSHLHI
jgi:hypothetical protein